MPKLPAITGKEAIKVLLEQGFVAVRQSGSHVQMKRDGHPLLVTVPVHASECLKQGTLRAIIRSAGMTVEAFCDRLQD